MNRPENNGMQWMLTTINQTISSEEDEDLFDQEDINDENTENMIDNLLEHILQRAS